MNDEFWENGYGLASTSMSTSQNNTLKWLPWLRVLTAIRASMWSNDGDALWVTQSMDFGPTDNHAVEKVMGFFFLLFVLTHNWQPRTDSFIVFPYIWEEINSRERKTENFAVKLNAGIPVRFDFTPPDGLRGIPASALLFQTMIVGIFCSWNFDCDLVSYPIWGFWFFSIRTGGVWRFRCRLLLAM